MKSSAVSLRRIAGALACSRLFSRARRLTEKNRADWNLSLGRADNLLVCSYLILADYAAGIFPPVRLDQVTAYENEMQYGHTLGGVSPEDFQAKEMRKPFWDANAADRYLNGFVRLLRLVESLGIAPGSRILELGCGSGWMAEFFALTGYNIVATTIAPTDQPAVERRAAALRAKGVTSELTFKLSPMESVDQAVGLNSFDAAYVHQALHHAHDWKAVLSTAFRTLKPGGWMIIADEPNILHTFTSYRMGKISGTHEIGMSRRKVVQCLRDSGYREVRTISPRFDDRLHPLWIVARK
jgi:2-polyprenyl-3-methyl-5-hydroxy-6-metoxy-1,4-benzoquinol methylase